MRRPSQEERGGGSPRLYRLAKYSNEPLSSDYEERETRISNITLMSINRYFILGF